MGISGVATVQKSQGVNGISHPGQKAQANEPSSAAKVNQPNPPQELSTERKDVEAIEQKKLEKMAKAMENFIMSIQRDLRIKVHRETGRLMVQVISAEDGKVIREIPPEELLNLAAKMEEMVGILFDTAA